MTIKQANELILDKKHEEAYKLLLGIKPSFQVMITQDIGDGENATEESKVVSKEMRELGLEGVAVFIYDNQTNTNNDNSVSYTTATEICLSSRIILVVVDINDNKADTIIDQYDFSFLAVDPQPKNYGEYPEKIKSIVVDRILQNTDYELDSSLLVIRNDTVLQYLCDDRCKHIVDVLKYKHDTIFADQQILDGLTLQNLFTNLMNLPSEQYKHKLKVYEYESDQDPVYYSDTWMKIANEVDGIQKHLFEIERLLKPSSICEDYRSISDCSMLKKRFFAEAVYRNIVFIHVEFLPKANEPTNMKQKLFYQSCELVYKACSHFIVSIIDSADIMKVAGMKNEEEQRKNKVDILSLPPDAGMEYM